MSSKFFTYNGKDNGRKIYFMANIKNTSRLYRTIYNISNKLNIKGIDPHFTILETEFNNSYDRNKIIYHKNFDISKKNTTVNPILSFNSDNIFRNIYKKSPLKLTFDKFIIIGRSINIDDNFIALKFNIEYGHITPFRIELYNIIANSLELDVSVLKKRNIVNYNNTKYYLHKDSYDKDIFVVPEYYFGNENWTPHISLCKIGLLKQTNPELYSLITNIDILNISPDNKDKVTNSIMKTELKQYFLNELSVQFCDDIDFISVT